MGCQCCRMIKSYIYDPSVVADGGKTDSAVSSLYYPHHFSGEAPGGNRPRGDDNQKQGFHNLGYSKSSNSSLKLEADNNQVNYRLHAAPPPAKEQRRQGSIAPADGGLYIIQPEAMAPQWMTHGRSPSQVPVYPNIHEYDNQGSYWEPGQAGPGNRWDSSVTVCADESPSADEIDEGVGGTPEYPCDTGDEGSVLSVDIHTSTTSLSSADTREDRGPAKTPDVSTAESGISVTKSVDGGEARSQEAEVQSVTDSMVAEALAALEAATADEDFE